MAQDASLGWPTWIGVVAEDLDAQRRFWAELLGEPVGVGRDYVEFDMGEGRTFELVERSKDPEYDRARFQVGFEVDDIRSAHAALIERGVEPITEILGEPESAWAYFRDPEGNVFEIKQRRLGAS